MKVKSLLLAGFAAVAIGSLAACSMNPAPGNETGRNRISGEELASSNSATVYQALELLRPQWMSSRGPISMTDSEEARPNVYMNGNRIGDLDYLKEFYVIDVAELRFWPPAEASARFGMGNPRGVIEVIPRS